MKKNESRRKKKKGARGVKIPGGGHVIHAHVTCLRGGKLVGRPLSRAETRKLARGPIAAMQSKLKEVMARADEV